MEAMNIVGNVIGVGAGFLYVKSSMGKLKNPHAFARVLESYRMGINGRLAASSAVIMGPLECTIGVMLILQLFVQGAAAVGLLLQLVFSLCMMARYNQVLPFGCGCFGMHGPEKVTAGKLAFNLSFAALLALYFIFPKAAEGGWIIG